MTEANTIPHLYLKEEIDITNLAELREKIKKDKNITFMTLLIKTFSMALLKYPIINSTYDVVMNINLIYRTNLLNTHSIHPIILVLH